ncbi:MAG: beta strand repeat-containing protein, partial [Janthinobacterium lividum]
AGTDFNETSSGGTFTPASAASNSTIYVSNINTALGNGTSVTISTASSGSGAGNITLASGALLSSSTAANLTMNADGNVIINGNIAMGTGALALNANGGAVSGSGNISSSGSMGFNAGLASASGTLSGVISGGGNFIKNGAGTLALSGSNTYTGATAINAGTLQIAGGGALGAGNYGNLISLGTLAMLEYSSSAAQVFTGVISGAGGLTKDTAASLLSTTASNTYTGATNVNAGTFSLNAGNALSASSVVTINNGGTLRLDHTDTWGGGSANVISPQITVNAGGTLASNNSFNQLNGLTLNGGQLLGNGGFNGSFQAFGLGGTINVTASSSINSGTAGNGFNAMTLGKQGLLTTTFNISPGATLSVADVLRDNGDFGVVGLAVTGGGTLLLSAVNLYTGNTLINAGTLRIGGAGTLATANYSGNISIAAGSQLAYSSSSAQVLGGVISGAGAVTKDTSNAVLTFNGVNTYTGATSINAGTIALNHLGSLAPASAVAINSGATLRLDVNDIWSSASSTSTASNPAISVNAGGTLASNNSFNRLYGLTMNGGQLLANGGAGATLQAFELAGTVNVTADSAFVSGGTGNGKNTIMLGQANSLATTFNVSAGTRLAIGNVLTDYNNGSSASSTGLILGGAPTGSLQLSAANLLSGGVTIDSGTLALNAVSALVPGAGIIINNGGTLRLDVSNVWGSGATTVVSAPIAVNAGGTLASNNSFNQINGLTLNGGQVLANGGLDGVSQAFGLGGTITVLADSAIVSGSSGNGYNGINLGKLGTATTTFNASTGATLQINDVLRDNASFGQANLALTGAGTLVLNGANTFTGTTLVSGGTLSIGGAGSLGSGLYNAGITLASGTAFDYASSAAQTLAGVISGAGSVSKDTAASVLVLAAGNTYTGATSVNAGVLALAADNAVSANSALIINNGGTVRLDNSSIWGAANTVVLSPQITVHAGGTLASNNSFNQLNNLTLDGGQLVGNGGLSSALPSFALGGTVNVTADSAMVSGSTGNGFNAINLGKTGLLTTTFNIAAGRTLGSVGLQDSNAGASSLALTGGGTLVLGGLNTFSGNTTLNAGQLRLASTGVLGAGNYAGAISLSAGSMLDDASTVDQTLAGVISGAGSLSKGAGAASTLTLSAANTYGGATTVNAGRVVLAGAWTPSGGVAVTAVATGAALSGNGVVTAASLQTSGGGTLSLSGANQVDTLSATGTIGSLAFSDTRSLTLGSIASTGMLSLLANGANSDLTIAGSAHVSSSAAGDAVTLVAGRDFLNLAGATALSTTVGRWQVYSTRPSSDHFDNLDSGNTAVWNAGFASAGGSVSQAGNRYVFQYQPILTLATTDVVASTGDSGIATAVARAYKALGVETGVAGAYAADTVGSAYSGTPLVTSTGAANDAVAGSYAVTGSSGSVLALNGYGLHFASAGVLTLSDAVLPAGASTGIAVADPLHAANAGTATAVASAEQTLAQQQAFLAPFSSAMLPMQAAMRQGYTDMPANQLVAVDRMDELVQEPLSAPDASSAGKPITPALKMKTACTKSDVKGPASAGLSDASNGCLRTR